jgi:hypothetical protein
VRALSKSSRDRWVGKINYVNLNRIEPEVADVGSLVTEGSRLGGLHQSHGRRESRRYRSVGLPWRTEWPAYVTAGCGRYNLDETEIVRVEAQCNGRQCRRWRDQGWEQPLSEPESRSRSGGLVSVRQTGRLCEAVSSPTLAD